MVILCQAELLKFRRSNDYRLVTEYSAYWYGVGSAHRLSSGSRRYSLNPTKYRETGGANWLDNLKLGYGGTASEMKRLVKEAASFTAEQDKLGVKVKANSLDFANIVNAIAVVQEHLGIAGTTQLEAFSTISGSVTMLQASWENLKTTIVDPNGDISGAIDAVVFSAKMAFNNLIPAIKQALTGIGSAIAEIAPVIAAELPSLISDVLPSMITAATSLLDGFINAITSSAPTIIAGAVTVITQLATALVDNIDKVVDAAGQIMDAIIQVFQESDSPVLQFIGDSLEKIKSVVDFVIQLFKDFPGAVETLKSSDQPVLQLIGSALELVKGALDWIVAHQTEVITAVEAILAVFAVGKIIAFATALSPVKIILSAIAALATVIITNWSGIQKFFEDLWAAVKTAVSDAWTKFSEWIGDISGSVAAAWGTVSDWFNTNVWEPIKKFFTSAWDTISKLWTGITGFIIGAWFNVSSWFDTNVISPVKKFFEDLFGTISKIWTDISSSISNAWDKVYSVLEPIIKPIKDLFQGVVDTVSSIWNFLSDIFGLGDKTITVTTVYQEVNSPKGGRNEFSGEYAYYSGSGANPMTGRTEQLHAKGEWNVPYDDYPALLHRGERVLTASQARQMDDGTNGTSFDGLVSAVVQAIREGMQGVQVNSYLDGRELTDAVNRYQGEDLTAGRFA